MNGEDFIDFGNPEQSNSNNQQPQNNWNENQFGWNNQEQVNNNQLEQHYNGDGQWNNNQYTQFNNTQNTDWTTGINMSNQNNYTFNDPNQYSPYENIQSKPKKVKKVKPKKQKKQKKKKKHKFLRLIAFIVMVILFFKLNNHIAEKEFNSFTVDYPFNFSDKTNSLGYVTNNFTVLTSYNIGDKEYNVSWSSNDSSVSIDSNGNVTVIRPSTSSKSVVVTQVYKKWLGKAERSYTLNIIPTEQLDRDSLDIITLEEIQAGDYNRDIEAILNESGNLGYIMGDFKGIIINSVEDALILLDAYKDEFKVPADIEFKIDKISDVAISKSYIFNVYKNGCRLENSSANVIVESNSLELAKIAINIDERDLITASENANLNYAEIIKEYISSNDPDTADSDYIIKELETKTYEGKIVKVFNIASKNGYIMDVYIDCSTGDVVKYFENVDTAKYIDVECTATDDFGKNIKFNASYKDGLIGGNYVLYDTKRNIHAYDNNGFWKLLNYAEKNVDDSDNFSIGEIIVLLGGVVDLKISDSMNFEIKSDTENFEEGAYAKAYNNLQIAYDYYRDVFGYTSYDNNGAPITVLLDCGRGVDNASWCGSSQLFYVNPVNYFKYSLGNHVEVMGHEYTHAVFGSFSGGTNKEVAGLNEAYADIFGCLIAGYENEWIVGDTYDSVNQPIYIRNISNINKDTPSGSKSAKGNMYSVTYKDEYWIEDDAEEHTISTIISNIAYKMLASDYFDRDDIAHIWFNSLGYVFDSNSTYVTCRKYVIKAAEELNYPGEAIDFIAECFDEAEILDPSYVWKVQENTHDQSLEASDGTTTLKTTSSAVSGDTILDDSISRRYLVAYSPADLVLGQGTVIIYEESKSEKWFTENKEISTKLSELYNNKYSDINISGNKITVDYRTVSKPVMDIAEKFCKNSGNTIKSLANDFIDKSGVDLSNEDRDIINSVLDQFMPYLFNYKVVESTPYNLYDSLGLLD